MKNRKEDWEAWFSFSGVIIGIFLLINTACYFLCHSPDCNHRFLLTKIGVQVFIVISVIAWIICHFEDYVGMNKENNSTVRMKFNHFKDVYYVNPDRWLWNNGKFLYKNGKDYWHQELYCVTFSYFDWIKFLLWNKLRKYEEKLELKRKKQEKSNELLAEMLKYIQKDIDEAYEKISGEKGEQK